MPLCDRCSYIRLPHDGRDGTQKLLRTGHVCLIRHHKNFEDLLAAADQGCEICQSFRPFVEHGQLRRATGIRRSDSDCDSDISIGNALHDPFGEIRESSVSSRGIIYVSDASPIRHYVGRGRYYQLDQYKYNGQYNYREDSADEDWDALRERNHRAQIFDDNALEWDEYYQRLARLGLHSEPSEHAEDEPSDNAALKQLASTEPDESGNYDAEYSIRMERPGLPESEHFQWLLQSNLELTGRDQLWVTVRHKIDSVECFVVLSAGSIEPELADRRFNFCVNGAKGYSIWTIAALYPAIWKYRSDLLSIPQKKPNHARRPVLEFYQRRDHTFDSVPRIYARGLYANSGCTGALELARSWLEHCRDYHCASCQTHDKTAKPARLVYIGDGSADDPPRLHIVGDYDRDGIRYATLSHCWGPDASSITKLTTVNIHSFIKTLGTTQLSQAFKDAIKVARALRLSYIWIDALCIIQDSIDDWAAEAANMAEYFRGSEVTISAAASTSDLHSFLQDRPSPEGHPRIDTESGPLYLRPLLGDVTTVKGPGRSSSWVRSALTSQPINQRAWTLQERIFSHRILHFTEQQLVWQCRRAFFSEDGQYSPETNLVTVQNEDHQEDMIDIVNLEKQRIVFLDGKEQEVRPSIKSTRWYELVKAFTQRSLTFDSDRLPAIAGLAREVQRLVGHQYRAGIWLNELSRNLMWKVCDHNKKPKRAKNTFPSWSWTAIDGEIDHPLASGNIRPVPELDPNFIEISTVLATSDPFGGVKRGKIVLDVWVHDYRGPQTLYNELGKDAINLRYEYQPPENWAEKSNSAMDDPFVKYDVEMPADLWEDRSKDLVSALRLFFVVCMCYTDLDDCNTPAKNKGRYGEQHFLVVETIAPLARDALYRRVGTARTGFGSQFMIDEAHGWERRRITIV